MSPSLAPAPELVWFRGPDAIRFLNDLISQEIGTLPPGSVVQSLLLGPQGKLDFLLWVLRGDGYVGLITEDGRGEELVARLSRYRIRVDVEIEMETGPIYLLVGVPDPVEGFEKVDDVLTANISWPSLTRVLQVGGNEPELPQIDPAELDRLRIEDGIPIFGVDVDDGVIPQEAGVVVETISFTKGCFLGQELVARLDSRGGRVNRHLQILDFESPVDLGTPLHSGGRDVGTVSSISGTVGLALLWREVEPGDTVAAGNVEATVRGLPQKTAGSFTAS